MGGQLYLPRLIGIGEPGSDVLISQDIKGTSDNVRFTFGNGDRVMTQLANDTDLKYAEIDLCLFHVNSGILLQLWKGVIQNFTSDGTPIFPVTCSDGFFQIMNQYPERQLSRQCWKTYNDGVNCPWATKGRSAAAVTAAGGDPTTCDYYLESANGCQVHGMAPYFGAHQADPQGVVIKDDSTGFLGFGRNTVTATSILSDTVWGLALPEIWCNSGGNPLYAFLASALMVAYRDESGYADSLGMPDTIGRITVPTVINSGQTFPLTTQYPFGFSVERPVIVHRFGSLDAKQEQRYYVGIGPRKFQFKHPNLNWAETNQLKAFWEVMQGPWKAFTYTVPNPGGSTTGVLVTFEQAPISFEYLRNAVQVGLNLIEVVDPTQAPTYAVNSTCLRFPSTALSTALLSEVQQIVPLVHIRVRESAVADIYVSDRRVTVGGQLYLPRLIGIGEPGSDVLISQDIKGTSDNVRFTFGNGDRVMTQLANDTDLKYAEIDLCLFHVNSGILLQLWKGVIQNFTSDGTPIFPVTCSDGFFQIMNQYPERQVSRQCWKTYNDGVNCPWASRGAAPRR